MYMYSRFEEMLKSAPFVYHYTSLDALFAILEGYRQNRNSGLPFRASCICNVNDPREMKLGLEADKKFLPDYEKHATNSMNLSEVYQIVDNENRCREVCNKKITQPFFYYPVNPNALEEIITGHQANYNVLEHVLRKELKECLLNAVTITPSSIEIK